MIVQLDENVGGLLELVFEILIDERIRAAAEVGDDDGPEVRVLFEDPCRLNQFPAVAPAGCAPTRAAAGSGPAAESRTESARCPNL